MLFYAAVFFKGGYFPVLVTWDIRLLNGVEQAKERKEVGKKKVYIYIFPK